MKPDFFLMIFTASTLACGQNGAAIQSLTMQSCMILFQSSPVTIRNSTVMAFPAVEKFACLWAKEEKVTAQAESLPLMLSASPEN